MSSPRRRDRQRRPRPAPAEKEWIPRTRSGYLVKEGEITSIYDFFARSLKIDDIEIVNVLVPNLTEKVLAVGRVQRQTDAGRKTLFRVTAAVGSGNGLVGLGKGKAAGVGTAIRSAVNQAKLNLVPVKRGCGSWECGCGTNHSIPFQTEGKIASVRVKLIPAPKGLGLVIGSEAKSVLRLAGIKDVWSHTYGETRTTDNFCCATFEALRATYNVVHPREW
ncbi:MAG: 30S ribosomal protein S5 [Candidatus Hodarchaeota archaeon]